MKSLNAAMAALLVGLPLLSACASVKNAATCQGDACGGRLVYFGTHGSGPGQGIFSARFDEKTGQLSALQLAAEVERPTWLVASQHVPVIYSVSELGNDGLSHGSVYSFAADRQTGRLQATSKIDSGGGGPTHFVVDTASHTLVVANFGGGQVSALPVNIGGILGAVASLQTDYGTGPGPRQRGPHAHGVALSPSGRFVLSADLGADRVFVYRFNPATRELSPADTPFFSAASGSGPRHLVFHPNGRFLYMNSELTGELTVFRWDESAGTLSALKTLSTLAPDYQGTKSSAELAFSSDGRFLYVSNRGEDSIAVYAVNGDSGLLTEVQRLASGGKVPWSFGLDPSEQWLLVANEASSSVTVFKRDAAAGTLSPTGAALAVPKPVSIAFLLK